MDTLLKMIISLFLLMGILGLVLEI